MLKKGKDFLMKSYLRAKNSINETNFLTVSGVSVIIKDPIDFEMHLEDLKNTIETLPKHFLTNVDYVIFGNFDFLRKNNYNAAYNDGAIYALNTQENNRDVLDDIVHEVGHAVEDQFRSFIYSDMQLEKEFLLKRRILKTEMKKNGIDVPYDMHNPEYDEKLDRYFSDVIGYPVMTSIVQGIYYSPYGATSLNEYFANGFEAYFYHKDLYLKKVSPVLFDKLEKLEIGG